MIRIATTFAVLTATLALSLPAQAAGTLTRSFVSSAGVDSNPCTTTAPCATFAAAYAAVISGGIVAALDPGKYGALTITGPVTINGNGWAAITASASGAGITVNAGTGAVTLIGLEIDGTGGTGNNGILINSAGSLIVSNCVVQNSITGPGISGNGIAIAPTSGTVSFVITGTTVSNNAANGILYAPQPGGSPTISGTIEYVTATGNGDAGIQLFASNSTGASLVATISSSVTSNNNSGIIVVASSPATIKVSIDDVSVSGNGTGSGISSTGGGIIASGSANVLLGRSVVTGNSNGIDNQTSPNTFYTYGDNRINLNATDIFLNGIGSAPNTTFSPQ